MKLFEWILVVIDDEEDELEPLFNKAHTGGPIVISYSWCVDLYLVDRKEYTSISCSFFFGMLELGTAFEQFLLSGSHANADAHVHARPLIHTFTHIRLYLPLSLYTATEAR